MCIYAHILKIDYSILHSETEKPDYPKLLSSKDVPWVTKKMNKLMRMWPAVAGLALDASVGLNLVLHTLSLAASELNKTE
jgi:hypothetical protein